MSEKKCNKCGEMKNLNDFHNDKNRKDGKFITCKQCHYAYMRDRYARPEVRKKALERHSKNQSNLEYRNAAKLRSQKFYNSFEGRVKTLFAGVYRRQSNATVTIEKIRQLLSGGVCPVTGIEFDLISGARKNGVNYHPFSPSVDKIDPRLGYTDENIRIVIWQYNAMKGQQSDTLIFDICKKIVERNNL